MLDYTRAIFEKTRKDLNTALTLFQFGTQILYIAYLIYLVVKPNSIWYLHLILLIISAAFLVFDIVTAKNIRAIKSEKISFFKKRMRNERLSRAKQNRKNVARIKFYSSHVIKIFVLASAFYPIIVSPASVHPLSIMCTTAMVLLWIIQIVFEVLKLILEGRGELFMEALRADVEFVSKPVSVVKNTFNKIIGREVETEEAPTKDRVYLDKLVEKNKNERASEKASARAEKKERLSDWFDKHFPKRSKEAKETVAENSNEPVTVTTDTEGDEE